MALGFPPLLNKPPMKEQEDAKKETTASTVRDFKTFILIEF
jgi:hypothetical protein